MKIKDAFVGMFVENKKTKDIGWIKGITRNSMGETIFLINWSGDVKTGMPERSSSIHPENIEKLK